MKGTGLGVTCLRGWQITLLACALNAGISHQQLLQFTPAFETSSQLCPSTRGTHALGSAGLQHPAMAPAAPKLSECNPKHSGKTGENTGLGQTFPCKYQSS